MISEQTKASAIAMLHRQVDSKLIADDLDIPEALVKEWQRKLTPDDIIAVRSHVQILQATTTGELVPLDEDRLKVELEKAALEIARKSYANAGYSDVVVAKSLQLLAEGVSKIYATFILKGSPGGNNSNNQQPSAGAITMFESVMKD